METENEPTGLVKVLAEIVAVIIVAVISIAFFVVTLTTILVTTDIAVKLARNAIKFIGSLGIL